ncbi:CPCC family cysteine-rich protein [Xenorhabdus stockiae]|uniref:CPCC family cysteine-rich protein n=1 Tax=Xenorhabdus stockiae TaxID=351614 RepID=UPI003CF97DAB
MSVLPGEYIICDICHWEDDPVQHKHPDLAGGANSMSLNEAKNAFKQGRRVE